MRSPLVVKPLVIGSPNWVGDVVMTEPLVRALAAEPNFSITVFCRPYVQALWAVFRRHLPSLQVLTYGEGDRAPREALWIALAFSAHLPLQAHECGAQDVWGYPNAAWNGLLTRFLGDEFVRRDIHHVHNYLSILDALGVRRPQSIRPFLARAGERDFPTADLTPIVGRRWVVFNAGSKNSPSKCFPPEKFVALARMVLDRFTDTAIILIGTRTEATLNADLRTRIDDDRCIDVSGRLDLRELANLLEASALLVSNDTGPLHIGAALEVPIIALFGPTSPAWTRPLGDRSVILQAAVECAPCMEHVCPLERQICFDAISAEKIVEHIEERGLL